MVITLKPHLEEWVQNYKIWCMSTRVHIIFSKSLKGHVWLVDLSTIFGVWQHGRGITETRSPGPHPPDLKIIRGSTTTTTTGPCHRSEGHKRFTWVSHCIRPKEGYRMVNQNTKSLCGYKVWWSNKSKRHTWKVKYLSDVIKE